MNANRTRASFVLALLSAAGAVASAATSTRPAATQGPPVQPDLRYVLEKDVDHGAIGHPTSLTPLPPGAGLGTFNRGAPIPNPIGVLPTVSPQATGAYVNYESSPVKAVAVNSTGTRLLVANTPSGSLTVMDISSSSSAPLRIINEIAVGIDPVSVAVQPGDRFAWVANFISDDVSVVDLQTGTISRVIDVGDEPVNILFSADGAFAYVVLQGPHALATPPFSQFSSLVTIDSTTGQIVSTLALDVNTARAAVYDAANQRIIVAAMHSGNNTTVVGDPVFRDFPDNDPDNFDDTLPGPEIVRTFSATAALFNQSTMAPYPDASPLGGAKLVERIVPDAGKTSPWAAIMDMLDGPDGDGVADPAMVALYAQEVGVLNAASVLQAVMNDAKDAVDNDLVVIDVSTPGAPVIDHIISGVGTQLTGMGLDAALGRVLVANMEPLNTIRLKTNLRGHFMDHQVVIVDDLAAGVTSPPRAIDLHAGLDTFNVVSAPNAAAAAISLANPTDVVVSPDGRFAYVAALGSGRIGVMDLASESIVGRVDAGRGTRSLALDAAGGGRRLFALNRTDHTVVQIDVSSAAAPRIVATRAMFNPEPLAIRKGRDFLFSTRLSNNNASSCAMCHLDGGLDHLAWDLGDGMSATPEEGPHNVCNNAAQPCLVNHPLKGPMVTLSLRGLKDHEAFHWRGDKPQFTDFDEAFTSLLGGPPIAPGDMLAFDAFVKTLRYPPNPFWTRDNALKDPEAENGLIIYTTPNSPTFPQGANCQVCHQIEHDGAMQAAGFTDDLGMNLDFIHGQVQEVTQLRGIYKKFPSDRLNGFGLLHDGREESENNGHPLQTFLKRFFRNLNAQSRQEMVAMITAFPTNSTNVIGWEVRVRGPVTAQAQTDINTMIVQSDAAPSRCDVVAQGLVGGQIRGYVYERVNDTLPPPPPQFRSDLDTVLPLATLLAQAQTGTLVFMAVPPGSGRRIAIDWDGDCQLNGLDPFPRSSPDFNGSGNVSVQDIFDFLAAYFAGAPAADFNWSGLISVQDIFDFLSAYFAGGCPTP